MRVEQKPAILLTNHEVYSLLLDRHRYNSSYQHDSRPNNVATIEFEMMEYLKRTHADKSTPETISDFNSKMDKFSLTKAERLQMLNLLPSKQVDLYSIIEEIEERFDQEQLSEMLQIIHDTLPQIELPVVEQEEEEVEDNTAESAPASDMME